MKKVTLKSIEEARSVIKNVIRETPLIHCPTLFESLGNEIYFKMENLQKTGSFKLRGALNKIYNMTEDEKKHGIIASSAGNHAQGVALGAKAAKIKAVIVMPSTAPMSKVEATKSYGAEVVYTVMSMMTLITKHVKYKKRQELPLFTPLMTQMLFLVKEQ